MRRLICIFLLMVLPLHAFAMQGGWLSNGNAFDLAHEIEHAQETRHHHDSAGEVHYDNSDESNQHASDHSCCHQAAALPSGGVPLLKTPISSTIAMPIGFDIRDGLLERPQRPPSPLG